MAQNEDKWGKKEAEDIVEAKYISGLAKKGNLDRWSDYASRNSYDQSESKAQSKRDLAPVEKFHAEELSDDWSNASGQVVPDNSKYEGKGWKHWSDVSKTNSYTGKGGSRRD
jgi:hypothetical protein